MKLWNKTLAAPTTRTGKGLCRAFTMIEVLIVLAVIMILAALFLPLLEREANKARRITCTNHLMQLGIASKTWALDHKDRFPMEVSTNDAGTLEFVEGPGVFPHFRVMSNELATPQVLVCPADRARKAATGFTPSFSDSYISYFVGVDAKQTNAEAFLSGDRNITNGSRLRKGLLELTASRPAAWTAGLHEWQGNIALADGSVHQLTSSRLCQMLTLTGMPTNRLAMP